MIDIKPRMIDFYMGVAELAAKKLSRARRLKVGGVLTDCNGENIVSFSFNGTPSGWDNNCEIENTDGSLTTKPEVIHAECNILLKVAKSHSSCKDGLLFLTHSPCDKCAGMIITAGIKQVYFKNFYREDTGIKMLEKSGIKVIQVKD